MPGGTGPAGVYEAVLFDMDGVLVTGRRTERGVYEATARRVAAELGVDGEARPAFVDALASASRADTVRAACERAGVPADETWARRERVATRVSRAVFEAGRREPHDDLDAVRALDEPVGVVSDNRDATVRWVVDRYDVPAAVAVGRDPTLPGFDRRKPDTTYLDRALDALGTRDAVYVGDRPKDVVTARRAGIDGVLLDRPGVDPAEGSWTDDPDYDPVARVEGLDELGELDGLG